MRRQGWRYRMVWVLGLVLLPLFVLVPVALAQVDDVVHLTGELQGDQYAVGNTVILDEGAVIHGDLLAAGQTVIVYGTVDGSVMAAGSRVEVRGKVGHAVRIAGGTFPNELALILSGSVDGDLVAYGSRLDVLAGASVGGDAYVGAGTVNLEGTFARNVRASGSTVTIAGSVAGDADLECSPCQVQEGAVITGTLTYTSSTAAGLRGLVHGGAPRQRLPVAPGFDQQVKQWVQGLLGTLAVGALLMWLFPRGAAAADEALRLRPGHSVGWGALAFFGVPVALLVLIVLSALLGLLVRLFPYGASIGLAFLGLYLLDLFLSQVLVGYTIGRLILRALGWGGVPGARFWEMMLGVLLLALVGLIPWVGGWIKFATILFGMGAVIVAAWRARRRPVEATAMAGAKEESPAS